MLEAARGRRRDARQRPDAVRRAASDRAPLRELSLLTTKPFLYVFNADEGVLTDEARRKELAELVAPADAVFLDAKVESELLELDEESARELLESVGQPEPGLHALARAGFHTLGLQTYLTAGPEGVPGLDDQAGRDRAAGGRRDPHRLRARLHQGRGRLVRRPDRGGLDGGGEGGRARCGWRARTT